MIKSVKNRNFIFMRSINRQDDSFDAATELFRQTGGSKAVAGAIRALLDKIS